MAQCKTLSVQETARVLGLSRPAVYAAVRRGEIPALRVGDRVLVLRSGLRQMLKRADASADYHGQECQAR